MTIETDLINFIDPIYMQAQRSGSDDLFEKIPNELALTVFSYFGEEQLLTLRLVSHRFNRLTFSALANLKISRIFNLMRFVQSYQQNNDYEKVIQGISDIFKQFVQEEPSTFLTHYNFVDRVQQKIINVLDKLDLQQISKLKQAALMNSLSKFTINVLTLLEGEKRISDILSIGDPIRKRVSMYIHIENLASIKLDNRAVYLTSYFQDPTKKGFALGVICETLTKERKVRQALKIACSRKIASERVHTVSKICSVLARQGFIEQGLMITAVISELSSRKSIWANMGSSLFYCENVDSSLENIKSFPKTARRIVRKGYLNEKACLRPSY